MLKKFNPKGEKGVHVVLGRYHMYLSMIQETFSFYFFCCIASSQLLEQKMFFFFLLDLTESYVQFCISIFLLRNCDTSGFISQLNHLVKLESLAWARYCSDQWPSLFSINVNVSYWWELYFKLVDNIQVCRIFYTNKEKIKLLLALSI